MAEKQKSDYILELQDITKTFPGVKALDRVSLQVRRGSVHALVGENGAGKSTLMKIINGSQRADEGRIFFRGEMITPENERQMIDLGVATIYQELSPLLEMTIAENLFLGREPMTKIGFVDYECMFREARRWLSKLHLTYDPHMKMKNLTISDMQLIEMVKAISKEASLIIMDEPTSSITESEVEVLFDNIRELREQGVSIIYISHKLEEIFKICDRVTVMRDGQYITTREISDIDKNKMIELMVGRELSNVYPKSAVKIGENILQVKNLNKKNVFRDINFTLRSGEILGFAGLVGAGRTELFRTIFGLDDYDGGELFLEGHPVRIKRVKDAINLGILMASEDRKKEGIVLCRSIRENISLTNLHKVIRHGMINSKKEAEMTSNISRRLAVKAPTLEARCDTLSGGNQQKVVLAKWLLRQPKVLILDEPTRGIDVGAKYEIYKLMCEIAGQGVGVVMISSELPEIMGICDRMLVMSQGRITGELQKKQFSQQTVMEYAVRGFEHE